MNQPNSEFFGNGQNLPRLHPDPAINSETTIAALCNELDRVRRTLAKVSAMQVVTPALVSLKAEAVDTLKQTSPAAVFAEHNNHG